MAISNVKTAIGQDLATLISGTGSSYSTTIKTFYKVPKRPDQVDTTKCPALCYFLTNAPRKKMDEATDSFDLIYTIMIHVSASQDLDEGGDVEDAVFAIYNDIVTLFNKQTCNVYKLDEVAEVQVLDIFPDSKETRGWAYVPIKIIYKR